MLIEIILYLHIVNLTVPLRSLSNHINSSSPIIREDAGR